MDPPATQAPIPPSRPGWARLSSTLLLVALAAACAKTNEKPEHAITKETHEAFFPLTTGSHGDLACEDCHVGQTESFNTFTCTTCHEHSKEEMDARHLGAVKGFEFDPRTCYSCHPKNEREGLNHEEDFPIRPGSSHVDLACDTCHLSDTDRTLLDCVSCHDHSPEEMDPLHETVPDYVYSTAGCIDCHPNARVDLLDLVHDERFPITPGTKHHGVACAGCHTTPEDRTKYTCTGCHMHEKPWSDRTHKSVPGYSSLDAACYACHLDATVDPRLPHSLFFPIEQGAIHANLGCRWCHEVPETQSAVTCANGCHPAAATFLQHGAVGGHEYVDASCMLCHADSQTDRVADHLPFDIRADSPHFLETCQGCHPSRRLDKPFGLDFTLQRSVCAPCHTQAEMDPVHVNQPGYDFANPPSCLVAGCHPDGRNP